MRVTERLYWEAQYLGAPRWDAAPPAELADALAEETRVRGTGAALDLGCGTGRLLVHLAGLGHSVTGVDVSRLALARARRRLRAAGRPGRLVRADALSQDRALDQSFNLILDVGFFHALKPDARRHHAERIVPLLAENACLLVMGLLPGIRDGVIGITAGDLENYSPELRVISHLEFRSGSDAAQTTLAVLRRR